MKFRKGVRGMNGTVEQTIDLDHIRRITRSDCVGMAEEIRTFDETLVKWTRMTGNMNNRYSRISVAPGKGVAGIVKKTGKPWIVEDVGKEIPLSEKHRYPIIINEKIVSFIAIPILKKGVPEGALIIGYRTPGRISKSLTMDYIEDIQPVCKCELGGVHL